jgi:hypothetical protein
MKWVAGDLLGWQVEVDDRLLLDDREAVVRVLDTAGCPARSWRVWIAEEPGLPVYWRVVPGDRGPQCFGGPSHPVVAMARVRAAQLLEQVVKEAVGSLQGLILDRRREHAAAGL